MLTARETGAQDLHPGWRGRFVGTLLLMTAVVLLLLPLSAPAVGAMSLNGDRISAARYENSRGCGSALQNGADSQGLLRAGGSAIRTLGAQQVALACEAAKVRRLRWALLVAMAGGIAFVMVGRGTSTGGRSAGSGASFP